MKLFLTILSTMLFVHSAALAQTASVKDNMSAIGSLFKQIGKTSEDASQNEVNADRALQVSQLLTQTALLKPDSIFTIPVAEQEAAFKEYQRLMNESALVAQQLSDAFASNDPSAPIAALIKTLMDLRKEGHTKFAL